MKRKLGEYGPPEVDRIVSGLNAQVDQGFIRLRVYGFKGFQGLGFQGLGFRV